MDKPKRSYYLPGKLVNAFDRECSKSGYVKEKVVAAAMLSFLSSNPESRNAMFEKLDAFLRGRKSSDGAARSTAATQSVAPRQAKPKKPRIVRAVEEAAG